MSSKNDVRTKGIFGPEASSSDESTPKEVKKGNEDTAVQGVRCNKCALFVLNPKIENRFKYIPCNGDILWNGTCARCQGVHEEKIVHETGSVKITIEGKGSFRMVCEFLK